MFVINDVNGKEYENLIEYAFRKCDAVMFVFRKDGFNDEEKKQLDINKLNLQNKLNNSFLKSRNGGYWVYTKVGYKRNGITNYSDPIDFDRMFEIQFYKFSEEVKEYLLTNKNLYNWLNPNYPEDIALFKNGYCWLYSVAHEKICNIYYESDEEYDKLCNLGIKFNEKYILPKEERYYEEYRLKNSLDL